MRSGIMVTSPEGRRFETVCQGPGPRDTTVILLKRLDRQRREQSHVWKDRRVVAGWISASQAENSADPVPIPIVSNPSTTAADSVQP